MSPMNEQQKICARTYCEGEFAWMVEQDETRVEGDLSGDWWDWIDDCGDSLFKFMMIELADEVDGMTMEEAWRRLHTSIVDIDQVCTAIAKAGDLS